MPAATDNTPMVWLILAMIVCLALAAAVVGAVAVPARREGRQVLTAKGEQVVTGVTRRTDKVVSGARRRASNATHKVAAPAPSTPAEPVERQAS